MTRTWDAAAYDRLSAPQLEWAKVVLERLPLRGDETVLDAGCGSGNVTQLLLDRLPRGHVVAVDSSESMVEHARPGARSRANDRVPGGPGRARAGRAGRRRVLERRLPLDPGPRRAVLAPPRGAPAGWAPGGAVRRGGQRRPPARGGARGGRPRPRTRSTSRTGPGRGTSRAPRRPPTGSSGQASRRSTPGSSPIRSLRTTRSRFSRPSASVRTSQRLPEELRDRLRRGGVRARPAPSWTTCGSTSTRKSPARAQETVQYRTFVRALTVPR